MLQILMLFFFKQKTAYEMRISDWSSDVCSSDLRHCLGGHRLCAAVARHTIAVRNADGFHLSQPAFWSGACPGWYPNPFRNCAVRAPHRHPAAGRHIRRICRSEEHTSELQSLLRISYAVSCLKKETSQTSRRPAP